MSYQDPNPERRNLIVLSMCIIVFYLGKAKIINQQIRLEMLNITFQNAGPLIILIWVMLAWFLFRYWLLNNSSWRENWHKEVATQPHKKPIMYWYLKYRFQLNNNYSESNYPDRHDLCIVPKDSKLIFRHNDKSPTSFEELEPSTCCDKIYVALLVIYSFFRYPTLSSYFVPYFLSINAITLGLYNL